MHQQNVLILSWDDLKPEFKEQWKEYTTDTSRIRFELFHFKNINTEYICMFDRVEYRDWNHITIIYEPNTPLGRRFTLAEKYEKH